MKLPKIIATLSPVMRGLTGVYTFSGVTHFVRPETFEPIVPRELPRHRELVYASGATELICAAGLLTPRTRRVAGAASAAMLVTFLPAHVEMSRQAYEAIARKGATPGRQAYLAGTVLRIVGQFPLISASLKVAQSA